MAQFLLGDEGTHTAVSVVMHKCYGVQEPLVSPRDYRHPDSLISWISPVWEFGTERTKSQKDTLHLEHLGQRTLYHSRDL